VLQLPVQIFNKVFVVVQIINWFIGACYAADTIIHHACDTWNIVCNINVCGLKGLQLQMNSSGVAVSTPQESMGSRRNGSQDSD
jgi:hypothetical protein